LTARELIVKPPKSSIGKYLKFEKGAAIFHEGDPGCEMYVIMSGKIRIFISTGGRPLTLAFAKKGDFFGEMSLLEELPRSASAETVEDAELIALGKTDFKFLIQQHPDIAMKVLARFSTRLRNADHLIELLLLGDMTGRVIHGLVKQALVHYGSHTKIPKEWFLPMSIEVFASESGLTVVQVEKGLKELERIGLVTTGIDGVIIRKHRKLKHYIEYLDWKLMG
jgi:CRP/FNR family transcriptional regulator, cyclic AMP receptor protein